MTGLPHSEICGYNAFYQLTTAYRRLTRPSSPLTAKASTVYALSLNHTTLNRLLYASDYMKNQSDLFAFGLRCPLKDCYMNDNIC
jgi:hypothetical protein